jgi:plasmid stability protein
MSLCRNGAFQNLNKLVLLAEGLKFTVDSRSRIMSQVTIRNMDKEVEQIIRQKAAAMNESLSSVINQLLRQVLGLEKNSGKKRNLRKLAGKWGGEELAESNLPLSSLAIPGGFVPIRLASAAWLSPAASRSSLS